MRHLFFLFPLLPWLWPFATGPSPSVNPWLFTLACAALGLLASTTAQARWRALVWGTLLAALLSCGLGLAQFFDFAQHLAPWVNDSPSGEVFANLRQRNQFATLTNLGLLCLLALLALPSQVPLSTQRHLLKQRWGLVLCVAAAALLATGNAMAVSRTGFVQLLVVLGLAWVWGLARDARVGPVAARRVRWVLLAALLVYGLVSAGLALSEDGRSILGRLANGAPDCSSRLTLWSNVLQLIAQKPWLGWGWGNLDYAHFINLYEGARFCDILDNAHNLPLHLAVELGVPFAVAFCAALLWWVWRSQPWAEDKPLRQLAWGMLALMGLHSMLEYPLWYGPFLLTALLCVWLLCTTARDGAGGVSDASGAQDDAPPKPLSDENVKLNRPLARVNIAQAAIKTVAIGVLAATAYAAWDYHRISQIYLQPEDRSPAYAENTLQKIEGSWLFAAQVRFARLMLTPVTQGNAAAMRDLAQTTLHYSPEARVVEKRIEASTLLGQDDEALFYALRFKRAYPSEYAAWVERNAAVAARLGASPAKAQANSEPEAGR
jgi:O-antigen ligase